MGGQGVKLVLVHTSSSPIKVPRIWLLSSCCKWGIGPLGPPITLQQHSQAAGTAQTASILLKGGRKGRRERKLSLGYPGLWMLVSVVPICPRLIEAPWSKYTHTHEGYTPWSWESGSQVWKEIRGWSMTGNHILSHFLSLGRQSIWYLWGPRARAFLTAPPFAVTALLPGPGAWLPL